MLNATHELEGWYLKRLADDIRAQLRDGGPDAVDIPGLAERWSADERLVTAALAVSENVPNWFPFMELVTDPTEHQRTAAMLAMEQDAIELLDRMLETMDE